MHGMFPKMSQFDLHHRIAEDPAPTLVFFTSPACAACRHLKLVLREVQARHPDWRIYEIDAEQEGDLVREFEVFHLPALFLFSDGNYHRALDCEARVEAIERAIEEALQLPPEEAP